MSYPGLCCLDFTKPMQQFIAGEWKDVEEFVRTPNGAIHLDCGCAFVFYKYAKSKKYTMSSVPFKDLRNKPKELVLYALVRFDGTYHSTMSDKGSAYKFGKTYGLGVVKMVQEVDV
jgi:hypothetical protein